MSRGVLLGTALITLAAASCVQSPPVGPGTSTDSPSATGPAVPASCQSASQVLEDRLQSALLVRGAYVSNLYVAPATDLADGLLGIADPRWAAGRINGAGVGPEAGVWLWDGSATGPDATVLSANASAARYFSFADADSQLASRSDVVSALLDCVGPMPEP
jgi:hypothetical protein